MLYDVTILGIRPGSTPKSLPLLNEWIAANKGRYNLDTQQVAIDGPVKVVGGDGFRLMTSNVIVDLKGRQLATRGPAEGATRLGQFRARHEELEGLRTVIAQGADDRDRGADRRQRRQRAGHGDMQIGDIARLCLVGDGRVDDRLPVRIHHRPEQLAVDVSEKVPLGVASQHDLHVLPH